MGMVINLVVAVLRPALVPAISPLIGRSEATRQVHGKVIWASRERHVPDCGPDCG